MTAYNQILQVLLNDSQQLDRFAVKEVGLRMRDLRKEISDAILRAGGFDRTNIMAIRRGMVLLFDRLQRDLQEYMRVQVAQAWQAGKRMVDDPMTAHGIHLGGLPQSNWAALELVQWYIADLLANFVFLANKRINGTLMRGLLANKSTKAIARDLDKLFVGKRKGLVFELKRIVRTELNGTLNLSMQDRLRQAGQIAPSLKKYWISSPHKNGKHGMIELVTNPEKGGVPIAVDRFFMIDGKKSFGPHDPKLHVGHKINCACRMGFVL